jgi:signal transduction histidine kinase
VVPRLAILVLLAAIAGVILIAARDAWHTVRQPFPGFFTEPTSVVSSVNNELAMETADAPHWPERIVAVDGVPIEDPKSLPRVLASYQVGDVVELTVENPYPDTVRTIEVRLRALSNRTVIDFFWLPTLLGGFYLAVGFWILWTQRRGEAGLVFAAICGGVALGVGLIFDIYTAHRLWWIWVLALPLSGSALIHLGLIFPRRLKFLENAPWLIWFVYLPGVILAVAGLVATMDWAHPIAYFRPWHWGRMWTGIGVLSFLSSMVYHRIFSPSPVARSRVRIVLVGTVLAFAPYVAWSVASFFGGFDLQPALIMPWLVLFPLSIAYAIPHYRALDIDWVLRQSLLYGVLALFLLSALLGIPLVLNALFGLGLSLADPIFLIAYALLVAMGLYPLYQRLQIVVSRLFGGARVTYEQALSSFGQDVATVSSLDDVIEALRRCLERTIDPRRAALYLLEGRLGQYVPHRIAGDPPEPRFHRDGPLARWMGETPGTLYLSPDRPLPEEISRDQAAMVDTGMMLFVPVPDQGWLAIGPPPPGRRFRTRDLRFLETLASQAAAAVERVRLVTDLEWRTTELETVLRIAQAVGYSVELDDLLELIYTQVGRVLDVSNFYVALHDAERHTLRFAFYVENGERLYPDDEWSDSEGLTGAIVRSGWPVVAEDYLAECKRRGVKPGGKPGRAWMGVPLIARDQVLGVMNVSSFDPQVRYTEEQVRIFRAVADQAAMVLDKARLYQELEDWNRQLAALNDVGSVITSVLDLDEVLQLIMEKAVEITQAEAGSLLLVDESTGELVFQVNLGPGKSELEGVRLPPGTGIVGQVAEEAAPLIIDDVEEDERWFSGVDEKIGFVTRSILCVPLVARGKVIGVIELINRSDGRKFSLEDQSVLSAFAVNAAVSIENARLFTTTDQALAARVEELSMMQRIDRELNASLDYRRVMDITLDWAVRMTGADAGLLSSVVEDEDGRRGLNFLASEGYPEDLMSVHADEIWPLDRGIVGRTVETGEPTLVTGVQEDPTYYPAVEGMAAQITAPIRREDEIIGIIGLESRRADQFDQEALDFIVRLADHAAIAIENARLFEAVQAANDAKTEFVSFVSHELKQPMTSIKGYSDLLTKGTAGELNEMQESFLEVIRANVSRMGELVQGLLDISRIEAGRVRINTEAVQMHEAVAEAVRGVQEQITAKSQDLTVEVPEALPTVAADRTRLVQILVNLLSNACKYTPEGGSITVKAQPANGSEDGFVRCSVRDTGVGISEEDQARLFTKYFRADDPAVRNEPGTGLGLVITKNLIELQGGKIWMESQAGQGSEFTFTMPVADHHPR